MSRRARRRLIVAIIVLVAAALAAAFALGAIGASSRDPVSFLATRRSLPPTFVDATLGPGPIRISWRESGPASATDCDMGRGAFRHWSDGGDPMNNPDAWQKVCVHRTPLIAWSVYRWQSLYRVAGEDWPNFEPYAEGSAVPEKASSVQNLHADEWEVGCGLGDPNGLCGVWTFRARYDEVLVAAEVRTIEPGIRFGSIRTLIESVDRSTAAKMRN